MVAAVDLSLLRRSHPSQAEYVAQALRACATRIAPEDHTVVCRIRCRGQCGHIQCNYVCARDGVTELDGIILPFVTYGPYLLECLKLDLKRKKNRAHRPQGKRWEDAALLADAEQFCAACAEQWG